MEKRCPDCGVTKDAAQFGRNKRTSGGLANYCKSCTSRRNRAQYVANQERRIQEAREYREANAELVRERDRKRWVRRKPKQAEYKKAHRERFAAYHRAWIARNKGYHQRWRRENPERIAYEKAWRAANWDRLLEMARNRDPAAKARTKHAYRARKASASHVDYTATQLRQKFEYHAGRCWICRKQLLPGFHWDHVKPLNRGGADMLSNLRPACGPCNQAKQDRWPFTPGQNRSLLLE